LIDNKGKPAEATIRKVNLDKILKYVYFNSMELKIIAEMTDIKKIIRSLAKKNKDAEGKQKAEHDAIKGMADEFVGEELMGNVYNNRLNYAANPVFEINGGLASNNVKTNRAGDAN